MEFRPGTNATICIENATKLHYSFVTILIYLCYPNEANFIVSPIFLFHSTIWSRVNYTIGRVVIWSLVLTFDSIVLAATIIRTLRHVKEAYSAGFKDSLIVVFFKGG